MIHHVRNTETRVYVRIRFTTGKYQPLAKDHYFRNEMTPDFYLRWQWYFKYRVALLRIKHPRAYIEYQCGPYEYQLPEDKFKQKVRSQYLSDQRQLTKLYNKIQYARDNWNELFPIEENPLWGKVIEKQKKYEAQIEASKQQYQAIK